MSLPLIVDVRGRKVVLVGGGPIAEKRVEKLMEAGASITVVSPEITSLLKEWSERKSLQWERKTFEPGDIKDAFLVIAATGDIGVDKKVKKAAENVPLVNMAGDAEDGNVQFPAHLSRGRLSIAVSTGGASPVLATRIRNRLEEEFDDDYASYLDFLYMCRNKIKHSTLSEEKKKGVLERLLDETYEKRSEQDRVIAWLEEIQ